MSARRPGKKTLRRKCSGPAGVLRIDRVGLAVKNLEAARDFFEEKFGATFGETYDVPGQGFRYAPFRMGGFTFELLSPTSPDGVIARFLKKRGEGVHHLTFEVADIDRAIAALSRAGYRIAPRVQYPPDVLFEGVHWEEAFIHPKDACGVLVHLAQKTKPTFGNSL